MFNVHQPVIVVLRDPFMISVVRPLVSVSVFLERLGGSVIAVCPDTGASPTVGPVPATVTLSSVTPTLDSVCPAENTPPDTTVRGQ